MANNYREVPLIHIFLNVSDDEEDVRLELTAQDVVFADEKVHAACTELHSALKEYFENIEQESKKKAGGDGPF